MASRRRKLGIGLLVLLLFLVGVLAIVDRIGAATAESMIADQVGKEMTNRGFTSTQQPDVRIAGFPFLTQVLAGKYDKVTITLKEPTSAKVKLEKLTLVAAPVRAPLKVLTSHQGQVTADKVTGTASIAWTEVTRLLEVNGAPGIDPSSVQLTVVDNVIHLRLPIAVGGFQGAVTATGTLAVAGGKVQVKLTNVASEGGNIPAPIARLVNSAARNVTLNFKIPDMPFSLTVNKVETTKTGIVATASADNVRLAG